MSITIDYTSPFSSRGQYRKTRGQLTINVLEHPPDPGYSDNKLREFFIKLEDKRKQVRNSRCDQDIMRREIESLRRDLRTYARFKGFRYSVTASRGDFQASKTYEVNWAEAARRAYQNLISSIRNWRSEARTAGYGTYPAPHIGSVWAEGRILASLGKRKMERAYNLAKRDFSSNPPLVPGAQNVGLELELVCKVERNDMRLALFNAGLMPHTAVKSDGSIKTEGGYPCPAEVVIVATPDTLEDIVTRTMAVLHKLGVKVNASCGFHVHVDARQNHVQRAQNLVRSSPALSLLVPPTRRYNSYCRVNPLIQLDSEGRVHDMSGGRGGTDRYTAVNLEAFRKHKTIEVRLHSPTTNAQKIINWVRLLHAIADANLTHICYTTEELFKALPGLPTAIITYYVDREAQFRAAGILHDEEVTETNPLRGRLVVRPTRHSPDPDDACECDSCVSEQEEIA